MSTVDDAVEAGARAWAKVDAEMSNEIAKASGLPETATTESQLVVYGDWLPEAMRDTLTAAWPVLSAGLRKINTGDNRELYGNDFEAGMAKALWLVKAELDRIDRELGIDHQPGTERAVPCPAHRPVQHRDARPPWCNACGLTEGGEVPTGPLDHRNRS